MNRHISTIKIGEKYKHLPSGKTYIFKKDNDVPWEVVNPDNYIIVEELDNSK